MSQLEWVIALIFTFWVLSFFMDLLPAVHTKHRSGNMAPQIETGHANSGEHHVDGRRVGQNRTEDYDGHINEIDTNGNVQNGTASLPKPVAARNF